MHTHRHVHRHMHTIYKIDLIMYAGMHTYVCKWGEEGRGELYVCLSVCRLAHVCICMYSFLWVSAGVDL